MDGFDIILPGMLMAEQCDVVLRHLRAPGTLSRAD